MRYIEAHKAGEYSKLIWGSHLVSHLTSINVNKLLGKFFLNMPWTYMYRGYMKHKSYLLLHVDGVLTELSCCGALLDSSEQSIFLQ